LNINEEKCLIPVGAGCCPDFSIKGICRPTLLTAILYQEEKKMSTPIIAINISKVANRPESFATMHQVGPKVCITTATHPGFLGFEHLIQIGILPLAGR